MKKKLQIPAPYRQTPVPAHRSREEIERILLDYGADGVAWQSLRTQQGAAMVLRFRKDDRVYRFQVDLGADARDERQRLRALRHYLKTMMEQAVFGILKMEDVFLAFSEIALPNGATTTVSELVQGQLASHQVPDLVAGLRALPARTGQ